MNFSLLPLTSSAENSGLQITTIGNPPRDARIFEPYIFWVYINNLDEVGHYYQVHLFFCDSEFSENGYINPKNWTVVVFTVVPNWLGEQPVVVDLFQDGRELENLVERKNETVRVTKSHSTYDYMLSKFDVLESDLKNLEDEISETKNAFDIVSWVIIIQFFIILGMAWFSYRKFRAMNERISSKMK